MNAWSEKVLFHPWVGSHYENGGGFGKRVLILGESHYSGDPDVEPDFSLTRECVQEQCGGHSTHAFWTRIAMASLGRRGLDVEDKQKFWDSVAFYNYVQKSVGVGPRKRPTPEMWRSSEAPFLEVLDGLRPQFVVVLGYTLWMWLPPELGEGRSFGDEVQVESCWYPLSTTTTNEKDAVLALRFIHPSSGRFSALNWNQGFTSALEYCGSALSRTDVLRFAPAGV